MIQNYLYLSILSMIQPSKRPKLTSTLTSLMLFASSTSSSSSVRHLAAIRSTPVQSVAVGSPSINIGTHDGSFHCDEALAIGMLKILPQYASATVVRTRNPEVLSTCGIVVDVGAKYDPTSNLFDHHQREFTGTFEGYDTKLSSAGLIYKHFGREIIREIVAETEEKDLDVVVDVCFKKVYAEFMEHIDAIDNGVSICEGQPKYHVSTTLSSRVGTLNPAWNEANTPEIQNSRFIDAMVLTCSEFIAKVESYSRVWWPARSIVQNAIDDRFKVDASGKIVIFESFCPWKDHLFELEAELGISGSIIYALYTDTGGSWRIQAVPVDPNSFHSRKKLPEEWCGLRDEVLSAKTGIEGGIFIHANGFIGGCKSKEGALAMASKALTI